MRASSSLTSIPQTLTPEAASVLNASIADASRRCNNHTTPLHVAAALLASPSGFLRQACIASHPNSSSHPLHCRALDLCFSVALERLPTVASLDSPPPPPLSNALWAALKRAQAHQRKGSPEQQQLPLLAVKVELQHLIVSILDDPSVSRVMKEARFSSPAIKSAVEHSLQVTSSPRSPYLNPRLHHRNPNSGNLHSVSPATFPRIGTNGVVGSSSELFSPLRSTLPEALQKLTFCSQCMHNYHLEIKDQDPFLKRKTEELMKKWSDQCLLLHPSFHQKSNPIPFSVMSSYANPKLVARKHSQTKTLRDDDLSLSIDILPASPVMTDLILGQTKTTQNDRVKDFKKLVKGLIETVWWQVDAASAVATAVTRCKLRDGGVKGDTWLLFSGPDRTGKKKMVSALSELIFGTAPVIISLGLRRDREEFGINFRGKTVLHQIAEGIRRNPFSVMMLQDIDEADSWVCGGIKRAMERGRFTDSYGREISVGNVIFVLAVNRQPLQDQLDEDKLLSVASRRWDLKLSVENQKGKKRCRLLFDLNEVADVEEERLDSSDLTIEHDHDNTSSSGDQLLDLADECIVFKKVDFGVIRQNIERDITSRFRDVLGDKMSVRVESEVVDRVLGGALMGSDNGLDSWAEKVLAPSIRRLKSRVFDLPIASLEGGLVARLELDEKSSEDRINEGGWMKSRIKVWVLGEEMGDS